MIFNEIYGSYFSILSEILDRAVAGTLTEEGLRAIVREKGFEESSLTIPRNLKDQTWPLLREDLTTPLGHSPSRPLTLLEKRWLKTLLSDPRIRLFSPPAEGLAEVEPLYPRDAIVWFDRYADGDPFEDPQYIRHFQTVLTALREKRWLRLTFLGHDGTPHCWRCIPYKLEYSPKDDKFRLITANNRQPMCINLARLRDCQLLEPAEEADYRPKAMRKQELVLELTDERHALERAMLHFSHLEKETEKTGDRLYRLTLRYEKEDEAELLIRVLSFGPLLKVIAPESFRERVRRRIARQIRISDRRDN